MTERTVQAIELETDVAACLQALAEEQGVSLDEALGTALRFHLALPASVRSLLDSGRPEDIEDVARMQWEIERGLIAIMDRMGTP